MEFLTNNFEWAPAPTADLDRRRGQNEVCLQQIKQTLQLCYSLGHSANALGWQVWTALPLCVLLRVEAFLHDWSRRFTRLFTLIRGVVWDRFHLPDLRVFEGTARTRGRMRARPDQAFLPGFASQAGEQNAS
jgi:hypothetical protein